MLINQWFCLFSRSRRLLAAVVLALACAPAFAVTFTNNAGIGAGNTNYDGQPVVITNCTVTVDGPHTFASVLVAGGGALTHSFYPGGVVSNLLTVSNETQMLTGTNPVTLLNSNVIAATVSVTDLTGTIDYTNGLDFSLASANGILTELQRTTNSTIPDGATVLVSYESLLSVTPAGLKLTVVSNVEVDFGGMIEANGNGFGSGLGAGAGTGAGNPQDGSGGGYGGIGGRSSSNAVGGATYGLYSQPSSLGGGGGASYAGAGGAGGGLIEITAGGNIMINGALTANGGNGANARSGGGAGGSVWLTAATLSGTGTITANGGSGDPGHGGGGGGGRIALFAGTNSFSGATQAVGGTGANIGGAGTVYTKVTGANGLLVVDNGGQSGTNTTLAISNETVDVLVRGNADVMPSSAWSIGSLTLVSNSLMTAIPSTAITVTAAGFISVETGAGILANAVSSLGNGSGLGGGGYGGNGGASSPAIEGQAFGSQSNPTDYGRVGGGGTGGDGGGVISITSLGGVVQIDGTVSANGGNGSGSAGGGGSGGSIVLTGGTLLGSGSITANGGFGVNSAGGGGGGRMAISPAANLFSGTISAYGGGVGNWGGAGTVVLQVPGQTGQLIVDNNGHVGATTPLQTAATVDLIVRNGAAGTASTSLTFDDLYLNTNGFLVPSTNNGIPAPTLFFTFTGNATIQKGGGIIADFQGYAAGQGSGQGRFGEFGSTNVCSGGGHGGNGGSSFGNYAVGGTTYDSTISPASPGSGGGMPVNPSPGGPGGGVIHLNVTGALELDGVISANGGNGAGLAGGGGAGGSILLGVGTLSGSGTIGANGGSGAGVLGGGGGGGIIYIGCANNSFSGPVTAYGGGGANWGGAGPVTIQLSQSPSQLILDGGGHAGPATPLPSSSSTSVTLRNGAIALSTSGANLSSVVISSNAILLVSNNSSLVSLSFSTLTIQPGGGMIADFNGATAGLGQGSGRLSSATGLYACSGAGHGGYGGSSAGNGTAGGLAYDYALQPAIVGSGGGTYSPTSQGGAGGGAFHLTVSGLLQNDGVISANGGNGGGLGGGGGSGGSIRITAGSLAGGGSITANGGSGVNAVGGGGAGGEIAISYTAANQFTGAISAYGGGGANWGGAGTVYVQAGTGAGQLTLDNDGQYGTSTPINSTGNGPVTLRNGAIGLVTYTASMGALLISSNATLVVSNVSSESTFTFSSAMIEAGGRITADFNGSIAGQGSGAGNSSQTSPNFPCSGGGHGGDGGNSAGNAALGGLAYDNLSEPFAAGSGGGTYAPNSVGGSGGGELRLAVTGFLQNDGIISANGANGSGSGGGGGAGGSIWITAGTLAGGGLIEANGGSGAGLFGGGGGGGIIAVDPTANQFAGVISAYGGGGANWGGAGSVYIQTGSLGQFIMDNDGQYGAPTPINSGGSSSTALTLRNGAVGLAGISTINLGALLISSNATLLVSNASSDVTLTFSSATIQPGGGIIADLDGYPAGQGSGAGHGYQNGPNYPCSGAGHGGNGGNSFGNLVLGGIAYDSQSQPIQAGSGGVTLSPYSFGGPGGGAFHLSVTAALQNDGVISANGGAGSGLGGGGGAGGSVWITAGTLSGDGSITANGGNGVSSFGGGGAGGCIAIYPTVNQFAGSISAYGGGGANYGGAGSIFIGPSGANSQFILDNNGQYGASTPINSPGSGAVVLRNGAVGYQIGSIGATIAALVVGSNGWLTANSSGTVSLTVTGNATVAAGGGIVTDGMGSLAGSGAGAGHSSGLSPNYPCSGGGGGGAGGSIGTVAAGGAAYGSVTSPASSGSGGGSYQPVSVGGAGGGAIRLTVNGVLEDDGAISANGASGSGVGGGGGSGGSIWLTVGGLIGNGSVTANGGGGAMAIGGGGGGGRIAVGYTTSGFVGYVTASGGGGYSQGGAGTIYTTANSQSVGQLLLDNGGTAGANTPVSSLVGIPTQPFNLTIQNGAVVSPGASAALPQLNNLVIGSGGLLTGLPQTTLDLLVFGNLDVAQGGAIVADGEGYAQAAGPGAGRSVGGEGSGAGYGGAGGASANGPGGVSYGSPTQPANFGSGGGMGTGEAAGGQGGGAVRINVGGVLTVDGQITANGEPGLQDNSGGGSGGSIWVTAGTLAGEGEVTADGGAGDLYDGGGGAGGRIALYSLADAYFGLATAAGAGGNFAGAVGTVSSYTTPPLQGISNSPSGVVSNAVSSVIVYFNDAPNPNSFSTGDVSLMTPNGAISPLSLSMLSSGSYQINFPQQTAVGVYTITVGPNISDLYSQPMPQAYTGTFTILLPVIEGSVTDTNGNPLAGVLLQTTGGVSSTTTDTNGNYVLSFAPGSSFTVTPSQGSLIFVPPSLSYTSLYATLTNQNYTAVSTLAPTVTAGANGAGFVLGWLGIAGVNYQIYTSTDLSNWQPYGAAITGVKGPMQVTAQITNSTAQFFYVQASN